MIVGYKPGAAGGDSILSLVVAVRTDGQWNVVGTVSNGLTPEIQRDLSESVKSLRRERALCRMQRFGNLAGTRAPLPD